MSKVPIIVIRNAPVNYQPYLNAGDSIGRGKDNGQIDDETEARQALAICVKEKVNKCDDFLKYLSDSGFEVTLTEAKDLLQYEEKAGQIIKKLTAVELENRLEPLIELRQMVLRREFPPHLVEETMLLLLGMLGSENKKIKQIAGGVLNKFIDQSVFLIPDFMGKGCLTMALKYKKEGIEPPLVFWGKVEIPSPVMEKTTEVFIRASGDDDGAIRALAIHGLGLLALSDVAREAKAKMVDPVIRTLEGDKDEHVRLMALFALASLADSNVPLELKIKTINPLINNLSGKGASTKADVAMALGNVAKEAIPNDVRDSIADILIQEAGAVKDEEWLVYRRFFISLERLLESSISLERKGKIIGILIGKLLKGAKGCQYEAKNALKRIVLSNIPQEVKEMLIDALIRAQGGKEAEQRKRAIELLKEMMESNISPNLKERIIKKTKSLSQNEEKANRIIDRLNGEIDEEKIKALNELESMVLFRTFPPYLVEEVIPILLEWIESGSEEVRFAAISASSIFLQLLIRDIPLRLKEEIAVLFLKVLEEGNKDLQGGILISLGELAASDISPDLKSKMADPAIKVLESNNTGDIISAALSILHHLAASNISTELKAKLVDPLIEFSERKGYDPIPWTFWNLAEADIPSEKKIQIASLLMKKTKEMRGVPWIWRDMFSALEKLVESNIPLETKQKILETFVEELVWRSTDSRYEGEVAYGLSRIVSSNSQEVKEMLVDSLIKALREEDKNKRKRVITVLKGFLARDRDISPALKARIKEALVKRGQ